MRGKFILAIALSGLLAGTAALVAQEGHPLTGSWHGEWHPTASQKVPLLVYMKWDSKNVTGTINPGPKSVPLKTVTLDANNWTVHLEADTKDGQHIVADGKIDNLGSYNRTIAGTWSQGSNKGEFKLTRD
jgi:hypothetical protein